ncbi:MAG: hypothetical protein JST86_01810 [Bacteroidetes bacterium]|nr:hypothetical protein [Bacteroidota bacterium]
MKKPTHYLLVAFVLLTHLAHAQRSDLELNRDSVLGWKYVSNPPVPKAVYKSIKSQYADGAVYSPAQQQASDMLYNWIQESYLPKGLVIRTIVKNDERFYLDANGPLHSYGINLLGYAAHFVNGKIDLKCCEQGQRLIAGFNDFPGNYIKGFNPGGLYFYAEQALFSSGDDDTKLLNEAIDKRIQPSLYPYRTYADHYHNNGLLLNKFGIVVPKNGEWPFKPVLVKDAVTYINQQIAAYPSILQKNPYEAKEIQAALERLKPYYNEVVKLKPDVNYNNSVKDDNGHYLLDPRYFINGNAINKTFPEYSILVSTTQQTIDASKTDKPLWLYVNLTPLTDFTGSPVKYDEAFGTGDQHLVYSMLHNFNFDYINNWLANPGKINVVAYTPLNAPAKSSANNVATPVAVSSSAAARNKDPYTILYENFDGYAEGIFSAKGWHTYGHDGHQVQNATLTTQSGTGRKWITIPTDFTFYPDFTKQPGSSFTVNYDVYFDKTIQNKRTPVYIRLGTDNYIDIHDINRNGFDFSLALSGEAETNIRFMKKNIDEKIKRFKVDNLKAGDIAHISISINGSSVAVAVNSKEVFRDDAVLPAGLKYSKIGWYSSEPGNYLGNIFIKSDSPVQNNPSKEPAFSGVVKDKSSTTPDVPSFQTSDYILKPLEKLDDVQPVTYPPGFKSKLPSATQSSNKSVASLPVFKVPAHSALLDAMPNTVMSNSAFKKYIDDLKILVAAKLDASSTGKIDSYLKMKKILTSAAISNEAINAWTQSKPTVALYLFCKAMQADYNDMNTANNLASLLNVYGYPEKALPVLQYINSKNSNSAAVLANMAAAYYNLGDINNAALFAGKSIDKDSLNTNANKVAAFVHLNKASQTNNKAEADKAISCLKQALKGQYDKEAADLLSKMESNHQTLEDYANTNFKEFPMLKRVQLPAMPEDLAQTKSFNKMLEKERGAYVKTTDDIRAAINKLPQTSGQQRIDNIKNMAGAITYVVKANMILTKNTTDYNKLKNDLADIYTLNLGNLTTDHNKKANAIIKKYNDQLKKLEGGEGKVDEEEAIERLNKQKCSEFNKEQATYLTNVAKLTNQFAQQSECVSRNYWRDYANWEPIAHGDNSMVPFLQAQLGYMLDIDKILSFYPIIEPCIYPAEQTKNDNTPVKPKPWDDEYCANFKGAVGLGAAKINFTCNSITISGGEGLIGEMGLNFNDNGSFKEVTIGAGIGAEFNLGAQHIAAVSAGTSALEYITVGPGPAGSIQVNDWGISAGVSAGGNIGTVGGEVNIISGGASVNGGVTAGGVVANALGLNKK